MKKYLILVILLCHLTNVSYAFKEWWEDSKVVELTDANFESIVGQDKYVFVKFYTKWCKYCRMMADEYEKLHDIYTEKRKDVIIARLEGGSNEKTIMKYGILSFPFLALFPPDSFKMKAVFQSKRLAVIMDEWLQQNTPTVQKKNLKNKNKQIENIPFLNEEDFNNSTNLTEYITKAFTNIRSTLNQYEEKIKKLHNNYTAFLDKIKKEENYMDHYETIINEENDNFNIHITINPLFIGVSFTIGLVIYYIVFKIFLIQNHKNE